MRNSKSIVTDVLDYEMVHWADKNLFIAHKANKITYKKNGQEKVITMPVDALGWKRYFMPFRKARRLLRIDKAMITPTEKGFVLVRFGMTYVYDAEENKWQRSSFSLNCRNPMYNGILNVGRNIYLAEYGNPNGIGKRIIKSTDGGVNWECVYQFMPEEIRHIHCLAWDPYEEKIWIFTGDTDTECRVLKADLDFCEVETIGGGSQEWRACHALFSPESVDWIMDSPLKEVHHICYNRTKEDIKVGEMFAGPVWFAYKYGDIALAATAQEIGPSHKDNKLHLYKSNNLENWVEIGNFTHDEWPKKYFRFGTMTFAHGDRILISCEGVKEYDGKTIEVRL